MFSLFKQTYPATSVEHAIYCRFYGGQEKNLVIAGANVLRIFRLIPNTDEKMLKKEMSDGLPSKMKLECLASYNLFGKVMSIAAVSLPGSSQDTILMSFAHAKLSLIEYDPVTDNLKTLSLHNFEDEGIGSNHKIPEIRVDPEGRCAALLIFRNTLAILPFRKDSTHDSNVTLSSYIIKLTDLEERVDNVIDVQFLHGYYEPTLIILYEPVGTFPGRIAVRQDTCNMVAVSLNTQQRVHPIIWSLNSLPFDCSQLLPVPKPLGGALIMAVNSIIYVNQSVPPYGVSVNSIADHCTSFPLKTQEGSRITLDCARAAFLQYDRVVLSLKGGELYVLTLFADSMRSVRKFHLEKAAASVLTTCLCICDSYLFLGSRLGNSLLLAFQTKDYNQHPTSFAAKKPKMEQFSLLFDQELDHLDEEEIDNYLYGEDHESSDSKAISYQFEVCDSLLNIGPCGQMAVGEPASTCTEFDKRSPDPDVEIVTTSGYGKNGAICVLQRSIKPQVVTTFELPEVSDMFTVFASRNNEETLMHTYLLLSRPDSTMVLQTGQEINEMDQSGFNVTSPTILAANLGKNRFIVQVCPSSLRLLDAAATVVQELEMESDFLISSASVSDPYIALLAQNGRVSLVTFVEGSKLEMAFPVSSKNSPVVCLCLYRDISGLFSTTIPEMDLSESTKLNTENKSVSAKREMDDEEDYLYGDTNAEQNSHPVEEASHTKSSPQQKVTDYFREIKPTYWLSIIRQNGALEIFSLNGKFVLDTFRAGHVHLGHRLLVNAMFDEMSAVSSIRCNIVEMGIFGLGHLHRRPLLVMRTSDFGVLLYEAIPSLPAYESKQKNELKIRFRKLNHSLLLRETKTYVRKGGQSVVLEPYAWKTNQFKYFSNIAGYTGVFIGGPYPHWLFMTSRGELRLHPMSIDGPVKCFACFHNVNCSQGFIYLNRKDELRICLLPTLFNYDAPWPVRKVPLRCTPHYLIYHVETKTYILATSLAEPTNRIYRFNGDDKELSLEERDDRFPYPHVEKFAIQLISPVTWEAVPNTRMDLDDWEHVTCLKTVSLEYEGHASGLKDYLAVSTNYNYGEDIISRGRIFILDLIEVVPEPGQPLTKNKIKTLYAKDQKGPVAAISSVCGYLVAAIGQKIYLWQLKNDDLVGIAFIDTEIYIHQLLNIKSFILAADVYKSVSVLRFQEEYRTLCIVARDYQPLEVMAVDYYIDNTQLGFLVSDAEKNLILYMYQPEARESQGGHRLIRKADFHVGQVVSTMFRIKCKISDPTTEKRFPPLIEKRQMIGFGTLDGGLGYVLPIPEKTYRRLQMLHNVLHTTMTHAGGLNPKAYRAYQSKNKSLVNSTKSIVDGELVFSFLTLPFEDQLEVARKIGTKVEELIDDFIEIDRYTAHF